MEVFPLLFHLSPQPVFPLQQYGMLSSQPPAGQRPSLCPPCTLFLHAPTRRAVTQSTRPFQLLCRAGPEGNGSQQNARISTACGAAALSSAPEPNVLAPAPAWALKGTWGKHLGFGRKGGFTSAEGERWAKTACPNLTATV